MSSPVDLALATYAARRLVNRDPRHWQRTLETASQLGRELPVIPPLNWVADLSTLVHERRPELRQDKPALGIAAGALRLYEDLLFERIIHQPDVQRLLQAVRTYAEADRVLAAASAICRLTQNLDYRGPGISPSTLRRLRQQTADHRTDFGIEPSREAATLIWAFVERLQQSSGLVKAQDLYEAESGLALVSHTQRLLAVSSHQLLVQLNRELQRLRSQRSPQSQLPASRSATAESSARATGGYQSIGTRGRMESLLGSELAYAEEDAKQRPDLFDARLVRGETLFFQRDESLLQPIPPEFEIVWAPDIPTLQGLSRGGAEAPAVVQLLVLTAALGQAASHASGVVRRHGASIVIPDSVQRTMADELHALRLLLRESLRRGTVTFETDRKRRRMHAFEVLLSPDAERGPSGDRRGSAGVQIRLGQTRHHALWFPIHGHGKQVDWQASATDLARLTRAILTAAAAART